MKNYLITTPPEKINWHESLHIKGLKINYQQDNKCLVTASDGALVEVKLKHPELKIELIMN
jgi:hypothetical protein